MFGLNILKKVIAFTPMAVLFLILISSVNARAQNDSLKLQKSIRTDAFEKGYILIWPDIPPDTIYENNELFVFVEEAPEYPGGFSEMEKFIEKNRTYPLLAKEMRVTGKVCVKFTINTTGEILNPVIIKSADKLLENEALRLVKSMPRWQPGSINGKKADFEFILPVHFYLR
ncbi:MAG: energy transducer TonB [Bacteroidota bacterium]